MANQLLDLVVDMSNLTQGNYLARLSLVNRGDYPPAIQPPTPRRGPAPSDKVLRTARTTIPAHVLEGVRLPAELADNDSLRDLPLLEKMTQDWRSEVLSARMQEVTRLLFSGTAGELLKQLFDDAAPPIDSMGGGGAVTLGRITLILAPELRRVPWELMRLDEELWRKVIITRRTTDTVGAKTGAFDLPVSVAISHPGLTLDSTWDEHLFDAFTRETRSMGGIEWGDADLPSAVVKIGEIHHRIFDSSNAFSLAATMFYLRGIGQPSGATTDVPPRLLVLHDVSGHVPPYLLADSIYQALEAGADAALLVAFSNPALDTGGFFPTFYRKLMHNNPLDQCLALALAVSHQTSTPPRGWVWGARAGGELRLLLTSAIAEAVATVEPSRAKGPGTLGLDDLLDMSERGTVRGNGRLTRASRASKQLTTDARSAIVSAKAKLDAAVVGLSNVRFDEEIHGVDQVTQIRQQVGAVAPVVAAGAIALDALAKPGAEAAQQGTVRMTNLWLTEGMTDQGRVLTDKEALVVNMPVGLHLQIGPRRIESIVASAFPEEALAKVFEKYDLIKLDVMFFAPAKDFTLSSEHGTLELPRVGVSSELFVNATPQREGKCRLRTCIYYRNVLLQSVVLEATVVPASAAPSAGSGESALIAKTMDYAASTDLALLDELPEPALNIFTNETATGNHWIGVYSDGDTSGFGLRSGDMMTLDMSTLETLARVMRELLDGESNKVYAQPLAPDEGGVLVPDETKLKRREDELCGLAKQGWLMFHALLASWSGEQERRRNLRANLLQPLQPNTEPTNPRGSVMRPGIVSIARCNSSGTTMPWAALYDLPLDTNGNLSLCPVFKAQLAANRWATGTEGLVLNQKMDLLDDPAQCRSQSECPLNDPKEQTIVCPFGFWGMLHQVEQPLQQVKPTPLDVVPDQFKKDSFNQTSRVARRASNPVNLSMCAFGDPALEAIPHRQELTNLGGPKLKIEYSETRSEVLGWLQETGSQFYYFFCHGEMDGSTFRLKLGTNSKPGYISAADLDPDDDVWSNPPQPLIVLNGCETLDLLPERVHLLLETLRERGAAGVVGTEIKVRVRLARPFGTEVIQALLNGKSLGEAFLEARRQLLRQYNPLGLAYSFYAPATLHLHDDSSCAWCLTHSPARSAGG